MSALPPYNYREIKRYFRDKASVIRIPRRIYEVYQKVNQARDIYSAEQRAQE